MSSIVKWSRRSKSGKDDHMNRKLNAAITAGLSLSMVLSSTPVAAIAAETAQNTSEGATAAASTGVKTVIFVAANGGGGPYNGPFPPRVCKCLICRQKPVIAQHVLKTLINV